MPVTLLVSVLLVFTSVSCTKAFTSQVSHDPNQPVIDTLPTQWHVAPDNAYPELINNGSPLQELKADDILPVSDPMVVRIQYWLDTIDAMLRKEYPAQVKGTPKPVAKIIKSDKPNAFVMDNKICLDFSLKFENAASDTVIEKVTFDRRSTKIESARGSCSKAAMTLDEQRVYLEWWIKPFKGCSLTFKDKVAVAGAGCAQYLPEDIAEGQTIIVRRTSHFISFNTEIFRHVTETEMLSIVAHELAHYYRSHGTADGSLFNFFYRVDQHVSGSRPVADASLNDLGKKVLETSKKRLPPSESNDVQDIVERASLLTVMQTAINQNLGQYTVEQEADELAVEWLAKLGLAVNSAIETQIKLSEKYFNTSNAAGWVTGTECRKAFANGWIDSAGQPMMVPVADWADIHHSPCFRAFNMDREIKAHKYSREGKQAQGPGASWETLVAGAIK